MYDNYKCSKYMYETCTILHYFYITYNTVFITAKLDNQVYLMKLIVEILNGNAHHVINEL